jgi:hypothetical protein
MNAPQSAVLPAIGEAFAGGFYAGQVRIGGGLFALIVAPKSEGEHDDTIWIDDYKPVPGAQSYEDGLANTNAMVEAGSELAQWARGLRIGGFDDWHLPAQDELEILYRNLKPTGRENYCYNRSGINLAAVPATRPYLPTSPVQTSAAQFREGGAEAFDADWYWSSTQHAVNSAFAWSQHFDDGTQHYGTTGLKLRARAVRRVAL